MGLLPFRAGWAFRRPPGRGENPRHGRGTSPKPEGSKCAGYVFEGSAFYVWDEDIREARGWARELDGVRPPARRSVQGVDDP